MSSRIKPPSGWKTALLDDVTERGSGHTPNNEIPEYWNGGVAWVSLADSSELDKGLISQTAKETSEAGLRNSSAVLHPAGTVIMSRDAGIGKSAVLARDMAVSQHFIAWRCREAGQLHNWFLYHWLQSRKKEFERQGVGSTIKTIGLPYFRRLEISYPPYKEQEKIAEILSTWDQAIATTERLIELSCTRQKVLMRHLLTGKVRLPGFSAEWERRSIEAISDRVNRRNNGAGHPILTISSTSGFVRQDEKYSRYMAGKSAETYIHLREGDFAYNKGNSKTYEFGCIFDLKGYKEALVPHVYVCFRLKEGFSRSFYRSLFESDYLRPQLSRIVKTGVRNNGLLNITAAEFLRTSVPVPTLDEQEAIARVMEDASATIEKYQTYLRMLRGEKHTLLQQILTGKCRVSLDKEIAA